jgi:hypothetical protein
VAQKNTVKHLNDWYHTKSDAIWQTFLEPLKKEAPEWKKYSEAFLDKMTWMQDLSTVKLGPSLWHMHPIRFLGGIIQTRKLIWMKEFESIFGPEISISFKNKVFQVGDNLSIDPNYIMACIALETGRSYSPSEKNSKSSATGLIQFMKDTALGLGTTVNHLSVMNHVEQMDYVEKYFIMTPRNVGVPTNKWSLEDVYFSIFTPSLIKKKDDDIVYKRGQKPYSVNLFHDRNKDGVITKKEISQNIRTFYKKGKKYEG